MIFELLQLATCINFFKGDRLRYSFDLAREMRRAVKLSLKRDHPLISQERSHFSSSIWLKIRFNLDWNWKSFVLKLLRNLLGCFSSALIDFLEILGQNILRKIVQKVPLYLIRFFNQVVFTTLKIDDQGPSAIQSQTRQIILCQLNRIVHFTTKMRQVPWYPKKGKMVHPLLRIEFNTKSLALILRDDKFFLPAIRATATEVF